MSEATCYGCGDRVEGYFETDDGPFCEDCYLDYSDRLREEEEYSRDRE